MMIDTQLTQGDTSWTFVHTSRGSSDNTTLRVTVHRDFYVAQTYAKLDALDPVHLRWNELHRLPPSDVFYGTPGPDVTAMTVGERDERRKHDALELASKLLTYATKFVVRAP